MDPASIVGIVATAGAIVKAIVGTIQSLNDVRGKFEVGLLRSVDSGQRLMNLERRPDDPTAHLRAFHDQKRPEPDSRLGGVQFDGNTGEEIGR